MIDPAPLRAAFSDRFGGPPALVATAPGRVNLIGEHTDYCGLPVLPIAIDRATSVSVRPTGDGIVTAVSKQSPREARITRRAPDRQHEPWHRYLAGVLEELATVAPGRGVDILVDSDLPMSGGLSSSSALSVGLAAALTAAWGEPLSGEPLAQLAASAERRVGVETGGMDQLMITMAEPGHALRIDFLPPATRAVAIPEGLAFVVAASGEDAPKGGAVREAYNERVVGTRIAALMLADMLGVDIEGTPLLGAVAGIDAAVVMVEELPVTMSARSAANAAEANVERLVSLTAAHYDSSKKAPVRAYARHVLSEAERVDAAEAALAGGDFARLGELMNQSHDSLRQDYKCSTPALDRVAAAMRKAGAFGARLTGAGFGGYAVAACSPEAVERVIEAAVAATGGPAFRVVPSGGVRVE